MLAVVLTDLNWIQPKEIMLTIFRCRVDSNVTDTADTIAVFRSFLEGLAVADCQPQVYQLILNELSTSCKALSLVTIRFFVYIATLLLNLNTLALVWLDNLFP
jgi:hypothetical protein